MNLQKKARGYGTEEEHKPSDPTSLPGGTDFDEPKMLVNSLRENLL
jgi:hypothetical protein